MNKTRRLLLAAALLGAGTYSYNRGLRYPPLWLEPAARSANLSQSGLEIKLDGAIRTPSLSGEKGAVRLRAVKPEPKLEITVSTGTHRFSVSNISPKAQLQARNTTGVGVDESVDGLRREIMITSPFASELELSWALDVDDGFDFAIIGDTGGGDELQWSLQRAQQLGALFLLHLGDFNYGGDEYQQAINAFNSSPIPCYVTIGNHDFHDDGIIYDRFRNEIGPMNMAFELAGTQFINLDTAADFFPVHAGLRAKLLSSLQHQNAKEYSDRLVFTHRPLRDPRPNNAHIVGGLGEAAWLSEQLRELSATSLLTGHVHHSAELDINGIKQWTVGEGLGHEDIVLQRQVAQLLLGRVEAGTKTAFKWVGLQLPWQMHTSHTHQKKLIRAQREKQLQWYKQLLGGA